jgi:Ca2+-binding EF-hand superfamily protein
MKTSRIAWLAFALCAGFAVQAIADEPAAGPSPEDLFGKLDTDGDGKLTAGEVGDEQARFFERMVRIGDKDNNNVLTKDEFLQAVKADDAPVNGDFGPPDGGRDGRPRMDPKQLFERFDADKNGKLTLEEMPEPMRERVQPMLERLGKTELTAEDLEQLHRMREGGQRKDGKGGPFGGGGGQGAMFDRLDANKDGKLTTDEMPERLKGHLENRAKESGKDLSTGITKEEFGQLVGRPDGPRGPEAGPGDERRRDGKKKLGPEGEDGPRRPGRPPVPRFFEKLDANGDHRISKDELSKAADLLNEFDENGDGELDPRELLGPPPGDDGPRDFGPGRFRPGRPGRPDRPDRPERPEGDRPPDDNSASLPHFQSSLA